MTVDEFRESVAGPAPPQELSTPLAALWWDARGDWARAHGLVDELESIDGMAVHAYLHRKNGDASNAEYWYQRAGRGLQREALAAEWEALVEGLSGSAPMQHENEPARQRRDGSVESRSPNPDILCAGNWEWLKHGSTPRRKRSIAK